ncbi:hypothetical protein SAMN04487770_12843 [Butyrivibrio sp. ob235]|uniref:hypothetical protein n=1 Tax=Butyrivibrio sp. ob235 TaxID=1761780 RepID=UPI0008B39052|nr:hypothetical protein [Butyrivibrio sp. ob235]SEM19506.1 hypothetical protein SAMN04487770_12843 [Butyrivibrio sp. ob235]
MTEFIIDNGIVIDDIEDVVEGIAKLSGKSMPDPHTIKRFITKEKSTKFYIDDKCSCKMQPDRGTVYLWLDSGFTDFRGDPIMISLLNDKCGGYSGHYYGTMRVLADNVISFFPKNRRNISKNLGMLKGKYDKKISDREHSHIYDEQEYLIKSSNVESGGSIMADIIKNLDISFDESVNEDEVIPDITETSVDELQAPQMSDFEKKITVELLLEKIEAMEKYQEKLLGIIDEFNSVDRVRMKELEAENAEYKRALVEIRSHVAENYVDEKKQNSDNMSGHALLGHRGKILVLGDCSLDEKTLNGIAKTYGFERKDFDYETDYDKVMNFAGRLSYGGRYSAIILGACPHKVDLLGDYSSFIEKCKNDENLPDAFDARTFSGELKVTKESYKRVLEAIIRSLREKQAA